MQACSYATTGNLSTLLFKERRVSHWHAASTSRCCPSRALKRVIEPAYFQDIFDGAAERLISTAGFLKREETLVLCESVTSVEQAFKVLDLIVKHLENKAVIGGEIDDWHHRKKYLMRLCELTIKNGRPEVTLAIFGNLQRFQIAAYFAKEAIKRLGPLGAHPAVLLRVAELCKLQRGPADKGVRAAYAEVVNVLTTRGQTMDIELLPKAKADLKALRGVATKLASIPPEAPVTAATAAPSTNAPVSEPMPVPVPVPVPVPERAPISVR